ncbi:MAG: alpha/beta fold hydrolase [Pseudolabrys sp.]
MSDSDLADLFPGYNAHWIGTSIGKIFARSGGSGPPLMLLHGYAQTNVMWHKVAPALDKHFTLIIPDLPGYGWSVAPDAAADHSPYDKRSMAKVMIEVVETLGYAQFALAGHDRGGRVAYRLALDHPGRLSKLAVLDIVPTYDMWTRMDHKMAMKVFHWQFLAQPFPMPEKTLATTSLDYIHLKMASWTKAKNLSAFDPRATAHYDAFFSDPLRIHATCEDYRAGATTDFANDTVDRKAGKKIGCPVLALWGAAGIPSESGPLAIWRDWADNVSGKPVDSGHFLAEENPDATAAAMIEFFAAP